ncbi:3-methyl-2-oxobutanoate hydroxymethyltransferase [Candidatus Bathyarchaeota archaeon]|jgi:3-methyl-2-oxobutanoate hydroxymethyltransferase|nr:3-methyl-2-oxobutanoate hydroxymethyltransferase [Candidatus Bathyarchaeota archaeon]MDP6048379.1 3-methyl-2-oxobutanoate hydroxymethyltransferase [Candidatus Bathyarchaeota archaeon]MDP7207525.1 3-methyl-2-oxobutanoate hydroxymethyltransferase [Candidatus Bathyarchaeota archaeon]MDP7442869.1 3-methyl-2-oxobutanoate hydroxymethyltransferase [Candidatus Bathyarchaeota archaeon]|tara:strand:+ start:826 stop:1593 length:768 start_codon:yes stop_codon:yes gene_type:complete
MNVEEVKRLKGVRKITVLTAYDYQTAKIIDDMGIDMILVGDSLGMVVLGYHDTKKVTMMDMIRHTQAVARGVKSAIVIGDLPIHSFDTVEDALANSKRLVEAGAHAVKLEGNKPEIIRAIIEAGIPVQGHLGLLPQTAKSMKVRGKRSRDAEQILADAKVLDSLGVFSLVLECIPLDLARRITGAVATSTIGIGAGVHCDGQVLVMNDMLGMDDGYCPRHANAYLDLNNLIGKAVKSYIEDVKTGRFPEDRHSFH